MRKTIIIGIVAVLLVTTVFAMSFDSTFTEEEKQKITDYLKTKISPINENLDYDTKTTNLPFEVTNPKLVAIPILINGKKVTMITTRKKIGLIVPVEIPKKL